MTRLQVLLPGGRWLFVLDALLVAWALTWIAFGLTVASEVKGLRELSGTVSNVGGAVEETGRSIGSLDDLPVIGGRVGEPSRRIEEAGRSAADSGRSSAGSIEELSFLLGLAVAVIPSVPLFGFYLPLRISRLREARAVEQALDDAHGDPRFAAFLARRAIDSLPYRRLSAVSRDPWRDIAEGRYERLAEAELGRLGVSRTLPAADDAAGAAPGGRHRG